MNNVLNDEEINLCIMIIVIQMFVLNVMFSNKYVYSSLIYSFNNKHTCYMSNLKTHHLQLQKSAKRSPELIASPTRNQRRFQLGGE